MMLPALTVWPAKILTPRRLPTVSRPLRLLPCPFLCAIARASDDLGHADGRLVLPVTAAPAKVLPALLLVDEDSRAAVLSHDHAGHACSVDERRSDLDVA